MATEFQATCVFDGNEHPTFRIRLRSIALPVALFVLFFATARMRAQLSANSGINPADTYVVFDLSLQPTATIQLNKTIQVPTDSGSMSQVNASVPHPNYHLEIGFDTNNQTVMNMTPTDAPDDPSQPGEANVSVIRVRNNQVSVYDGNGHVLPFMGMDMSQTLTAKLFPTNVPTSRSLTNTLIISDPQVMANSINGTVVSNNGSAAVISASMQNGSGQITYTAANGVWIASQISTTATVDGQAVTTTTLFHVTAFNSNPTADAQRASTSAAFPTHNGSGQGPSYVWPVPNAITYPPFGSTGSQNLILQHGLGGSSASWGDRMQGWLQSDLNLGRVANYSLTSSDGIPSQADDLAGRLSRDGQPASIGLGHSQGGLVLRSLMQRYPNSPMQALVTVETPNRGAWSATLAGPAAGAISALLLHHCFPAPSPLNYPVCGLGALPGVAQAINLGLSSGSNGFGENVVDLTPFSSFLSTLNGGTESLRRLSLEAHSNKRWLWVRWVGDSVCANSTHTACGQNYYDAAQIIYYFNVARFVIDCVLSIFFDVDAALDAIYAAIDILKMESSDLIWDVATGAVGDSSDALVTGTSQHYPNGTDPSFVIGDADSHSGSMHSPKVRYALDQILQQRFLVPHSGCTYAVSAPPTMPFNGGYLNVSVTAGAGCYWSALSSAGFVEEGAEFSGSATAAVWMELNLSNQPRSTVINVQGQTVTVTQDAAPQNYAVGSLTITGEVDQQYTGPCNGPGGSPTWDDSYPPCENGNGPWDHGFVYVSAGGSAASAYYDKNSTDTSLARDLATGFSGEVVGGTIGGKLYLVSTGATSSTNTDYSIGVDAETNSQWFYGPSFMATADSSTMTGNP